MSYHGTEVLDERASMRGIRSVTTDVIAAVKLCTTYSTFALTYLVPYCLVTYYCPSSAALDVAFLDHLTTSYTRLVIADDL